MAHQAVLSWTASVDGGQYNVYRGTAPGAEGATPLNSTPITGTSYTDPTVVAGTTYYYVVETILNGVSSGKSNEVSGTIPIAPPTGLTLTVS